MAKPPKKNLRKGGRKAVDFVLHPDTEEEVEGLRLHKSSGRFYRIENGKDRVYYLKNGRKGVDYLRRAIYEHECWEAGREPEDSLEVVARRPAHDDFGEEIPLVGAFDKDGRAVNVYRVGKEDLAAHFRDQLSNPETRAEFASMVGVPELRNLTSLPPVAAPLPLAKIIENYVEGKILKHNRQYQDAKRWWKLFAEAVGVEVIDEIDSTHLQRFHKAVRKAGEPRTQKNIIHMTQSILKYASDIFKHHRASIEDLRSEIRRICKPAKQKQPTSQPMKKAAYLKLLEQCETDKNLMWYAILVVSLNLALHPSEMAELKTSEFDLDELVFQSNRTKTGVTRVAAVWPRTAAALDAYMQTEHFKANNSPLLFTTTKKDRKGQANRPLKIARTTAKIRRLRRNAGLGDEVVFDGIRDLFRTSAGADSIVAIKWAMGHSLGEDDTYAFRDPKETRKVMRKVEKVVFGSNSRRR